MADLGSILDAAPWLSALADSWFGLVLMLVWVAVFVAFIALACSLFFGAISRLLGGRSNG